MGTARSLHRRIDPQILGQALKAIAERKEPMHKAPRAIPTHPPLEPLPPKPRPLAYCRRREEKARRQLARAQQFNPVRGEFHFPRAIRKIVEASR